MMHIYIVLALTSIAIGSSYGEQCGSVADIAFVIDSSSSIWGPNFNKSKDFIEAVIRSFPIGTDETHIAAITFGHKVVTEFTFNDYKDADSNKVAQRIQDIRHAKGEQTMTHLALIRMTKEIFSARNGARDDVPHICVLLTDGRSTYPKNTLPAATDAKKEGIKIIAIGMGNKVDKSEIKNIVSEPASENAIFKSSYTDLENSTFQQLVAHKTCVTTTTTTEKPTTTTTTATTTTTVTEPPTTTPEPTTTASTPKPIIDYEPEKECQGIDVDVLFVLDMSSSIWEVDFDTQLDFVADVVENFDINGGKTKVAAVSFSDNPRINFDFNTYNSLENVQGAIRKIDKENGITNTHLALETAMEMFTPAHGSRPDVSHICILITDGISSLPKKTEPVAKQVHDEGIYVFTIGVGNMTDKAELEMMASKPADRYSFSVGGYKALSAIKKAIAYQTCKVPADKNRCLKDSSTEIMFGLYGIGGIDRVEAIEFMRRIAGGFGLEAGRSTVGMYETCGNAELARTTYDSSDHFYGELNSAMTLEISGLLKNIRNAFTKPTNKDKTRRVTILLVGDKIADVNELRSDLQYLKFISPTVIVVKVGKAATDDVTSIATSKSHVLTVMDSGYGYVTKKIPSLLCKGQ